MLRLLLDHHLSPDVIAAARKKAPDIRVQHVQELGWQRLPDPALLSEAHRLGLTLITYDVTTIPKYLQEFAERGQPHSGVVFVDGRTIPARDRGGLGRALARLWEKEKDAAWENRTCWLTRGG